MEEITLTVDKRDVLGKKNRFLRRQGITPVHVFGHGVESQTLQCDTTELRSIIVRAGETRLIKLLVKGEEESNNVFIKEIQKDPFGKELFHVDFYQVRMGEKMQVTVPIVLVGEPPALKEKGCMVTHGITELSIECTPDKVPPQIKVDITILEEIEQAIFVKDIVFDPDVTVHDDPEQLIVKISEVLVIEEEEAVVEAEEGEEAEGEAGEGEGTSAESSAETKTDE